MPADLPVVVVGAGLAGAAAAWRLTRAGRQVVLVEAVAPAHGGGSSHGSARIFRHAYADPLYVGLTLRALDGWRELEAESGTDLLTITGGLDLGERRDLPGLHAALDAWGVAHEVLPAEEARERWPHLAADGPVLHHPGAGVLDAERAVQAMVALAVAAGAELVTGEGLVGLRERADVVEVRLPSRTIRADSVVLALGGWLPEVLPSLPPAIADRMPPLVVTQQQVFHFPFAQPVPAPTDWPVLVHQDGLSIYALPGGRDAGGRGFKIAEHDRGTPTTASGRSGIVDPGSRERIVGYVRRMLPGTTPEPYAEATCLYTSTPTEDFVIDRVGRIVVASACSGHGAKFAPLTGALIAEAALDRRDAVPARFHLPAP